MQYIKVIVQPKITNFLLWNTKEDRKEHWGQNKNASTSILKHSDFSKYFYCVSKKKEI